ncbi:retrovirus-related Pol polyprotein from transposon TNT 1-94 [Trifolium medium]|uniref:Retrovirus-related Pol polyprotein from transposon TNT 1-94 n=1 Tax=Trifolium medium TaxID=97028 RepID=A0A392M0P5_9FABA|nr:retrovirus-related Pol polyprotein from transposon TNT 1-94 [Trifolium medium]
MQQALQVHTKNDGKDKKKWKKGKEKWLKGKSKTDDKTKSFIREGFVNSQKKKEFDKSIIQCYNCEKYDHFADECKYGKGKKKSKSDDDANVAQNNESEKDIVLLMMATTCEGNPMYQEWYSLAGKLSRGCLYLVKNWRV